MMKEYAVAIRYQDGHVHQYQYEACNCANAALKASLHLREFQGELVYVGEAPYVEEQQAEPEPEIQHPELALQFDPQLPFDGFSLGPFDDVDFRSPHLPALAS